MNDPEVTPTNLPVEPDTSKEDVELNDSEVQKIDGGAFDAYLYFPPAPHH